jgi:hypothetical protein
LPVDPPARIDDGSFLGDLCRLFTACDEFDVRLIFRKDSPDAYVSVPQPVGEFGVRFDPIASVVRFDNHRESVEPTGALDLIPPNEHRGQRAVRLVVQQP